MADLGPHNLQGNEVLVYIRRLSKNAPPPPNWVPYEYHLMSSLPTNDNPRYSIGEHNGDMTTKYTYFYRFDIGPPESLKIQTGPYSDDGILGIAQVKLYNADDTSDTFYQVFSTSKKEEYDHIPFVEGQLGVRDQYGNFSNKRIDYSGVPELKFGLVTDIRKEIRTEEDFNKLPLFPIINKVPSLVDQTGIIKIDNSVYNETASFFYKTTYGKTFQICQFESIDKDLTPFAFIKSEPADFAPIVTDSGNAQNIHGAVIDTPPSPVVKARPVGTQLHKIPLHEITNSYRGTNCKSTHLAYLIGPFSRSAPREFIGQSNPDDKYKIYEEVNPATYLFTNSSSFYQRLPECWPWSCRRWTVEKKQDDKGDWVIKYYAQDYLGNKIEMAYDQIPKINVWMSAINGQSLIKYIPILNGDPTATTPYTIINPDGDSTFIDGYLLTKLNLNMDTMDAIKIKQCGCKEDVEKIELAVEVFPLLHNAQCKLIMKTGYLCYRTTDCTNPSPGLVNKKIIAPFNSCRFNETMAIDLDKTTFPDNSLETYSITFEQKDDTIISYLKLPNLTSFDPYNHPQGTTLSLDGGSQTITLDENYKGYLSISARFPCNYSSDINVYKITQGTLQKFTIFPNNEVYNCTQNYIGYSWLKGNGTDWPEDPNTIVTGADYYLSNGKHIYYNDSDPDISYENYKISSMGNAGGFLNLQSTCCDYCVNKDGVYKANDACFALDIEGTNISVDHFLRAGSCDNNLAEPCDSNIIKGRAILRAFADMPSDYIYEGSLDASGTMVASGVIKAVGLSDMPASGTVNPSGVVRVIGYSTFNMSSSFEGTPE